MQIVLATHNKAKTAELRYAAHDLEKKGFSIVSLADLNITEEPEETGKTFEENSLLKAKFYANLVHSPVIADDGGLTIPSLNDEPGVKSRRWLGYAASDEELIIYTLERLHGFPKEKRYATLQTCLSFYDPIKQIHFQEKEGIKGWIAEKPSGKATSGYPYRALFIVEKFNKYYDELNESEHQQINHRLHAMQRLNKRILAYITTS